MSRSLRNFLLNSFLVFVAVAFSCLLGEGICRIFYDPIDYLMPYLEHSEILGTKIRKGSAGHDANGYRNKTVPAQSDIVVIGDSQTYGTNASLDFNWPSLFAKASGRSVYNISLPGYNPVKFRYLLKEEALKLKPKVAIVSFFTGNDLYEAYQTVYTADYWKHLRQPDFKVDDKIKPEAVADLNKPEARLLGKVRYWLAHHSIFYRIFTNKIGDLFRFMEAQKISGKDSQRVILQGERRTALSPFFRLENISLAKPAIREGLRICLEEFKQMKKLCEDNSVRFFVVIIPSKETIFSEYIGKDPRLKHMEILNQVLEDENKIRISAQSFFEKNGIAYIDTQELLRQALQKEQIYLAGTDDHPNEKGYAVIAAAVAKAMERK